MYVKPDQRGSGEGYVAEKDKDRVVRFTPTTGTTAAYSTRFLNFYSLPNLNHSQMGRSFYLLYAVKKTPELTGELLTNAQASVDPEDNRPVVNMEMNSEGARDWARITGSNIGKRIAIIMDKGVFSAPVVQGKIPQRPFTHYRNGISE